MSAQGSFIADDGVRIGYRQGGSGPPLLLVHGGATDHRCFETIRGRLESEFTVTAYDRRGRGMSGDHPEYSLGREAADFVQAAEVAGGGEPVAVIAYSFGATVALHAVSTRAARVRALVAYEAPANAPSMIPAEQDILALIAAGRHDAAVRLFVRSTFLLPDPVVEAMAAHPMWQVSLAAVPTLPREAAALRTMAIAPPTVPVPPVRYLVADDGGNPAFRQIADAVQRVIPGADVATVPGLPHFAMDTQPEAFLARALEHLRAA